MFKGKGAKIRVKDVKPRERNEGHGKGSKVNLYKAVSASC